MSFDASAHQEQLNEFRTKSIAKILEILSTVEAITLEDLDVIAEKLNSMTVITDITRFEECFVKNIKKLKEKALKNQQN